MTGRRRRGLGAFLLAAATTLAVGPGPASALSAGSASVEIGLPEGTPLAGYGGFPRRAWFPRLFGGGPAFWFRPSRGVHDAPRARALAVEGDATRVLWLTVDLVGIDPALTAELRERLARAGHEYAAVIVSASHTHSGPGAFGRSALFSLIALDRLSVDVRARILDGLERAAREAEARKAPALVGSGRVDVTGLARSRVGAPLDPELALVKVVTTDGRPVAMLWNYAIHGTALGKANRLISGDLMADASARIERRLDAPALFVNGAVGDVSPVRHGWSGVREAGLALSTAALAAWDQVAPEAEARLAVLAGQATLPPAAVRVRNCLGRLVPRWLYVGLGDALRPPIELVAGVLGRTAWVTIPGELQTRLGQDIKASGRSRFAGVLVAGVSNDYHGYFLAPDAFDRPSYVACASLYGERGGETIRDAAIALLRGLADGRRGGS